jgi:iron complex transport system ATP-binding protein
MAVVLEARSLSYSYQPDQPVLRNVSVAVEANSVVYLLGHNGCGKTTLLEILAGLRAPQAGGVWLDGASVHRMPPPKRAQHIGLVPQLHTPVFAYTVREVVLMGRTPYLNLFGTPGRPDYAIVDEAIETVGLTRLRDRSYTELSGGERQLALIARGLAQQTGVLLLDEPTAHLDPRNQRLVLETVSQLAEQRISFVISSHNPNSALLYAHQVIVMKAGQVVTVGRPLDVLTEETLSQSYDMPVEVIYNQDHVARAIVPRRNGGADYAAFDDKGSLL